MILREIAHENADFTRWATKNRLLNLPLGIFRVAIGHLSSLDWACSEVRLGMFRVAKDHVSQCERPCFAMQNAEFGVAKATLRF